MSDLNTAPNTQDSRIPVFDKEDVEKNKVMAGLAYIIFFLPLVACPEMYPLGLLPGICRHFINIKSGQFYSHSLPIRPIALNCCLV